LEIEALSSPIVTDLVDNEPNRVIVSFPVFTLGKNDTLLTWVYDLFHRFGMGKRSMEDKILEEADYLNEELQKQNGKPFDIAVSCL